MDKNLIKEELLKKEEKHIELSIKDYHDFLNQTEIKGDGVIDLDDHSHHFEAAALSKNLDKAIHNHEEHLAIIKAISFEPKTKVEPGAILSINGRCMIVAVSKPPFKIGDRDFIGISTNAPIYTELKGKKAGESFMFNNQKFNIDTVY